MPARALTDARIVELAVSQAVPGAVLTLVVVSSPYGSGDLCWDYQLCSQRRRRPRSASGLSFAARIAAAIAAVIAIDALTSAGPEVVSNQLEVFAGDEVTLYLAFAFALFGARMIEELFFGGLCAPA